MAMTKKQKAERKRFRELIKSYYTVMVVLTDGPDNLEELSDMIPLLDSATRDNGINYYLKDAKKDLKRLAKVLRQVEKKINLTNLDENVLVSMDWCFE